MIGTYRHVVAAGPDGPMYGNSPIYGTRHHFLPSVNKTMFQVQVMFLGSPVWINVDERDVKLN